MSNSSKIHWTESAIECYKRGYDCIGCPTQELISIKCRMKESVLKLIKTKGLPPKDDNLFPEFKNMALKLIKLIHSGFETIEELSSELGSTKQSIISCLNAEIFPVFEQKGFIRPKNNAFPVFIDFFKNSIVKKQFLKNDNTEEKIMFDADLKIKYADFLQPLVEAIKKGYESYDDLVRETSMTKHQISVYWVNLLNPWIKTGLISRNSGKTQKQEVIDFIRNRLIDIQNGNVAEIKEQTNEVKEPITKLKGKIEIKKKVIAAESTIQKPQSQKPDDFLSNQPLTETEHTVLELLLQGLNYQQISEKITIALTTVKTHVNNIFTKRGYHSLQELLVTELNKNKSNLAEKNKNSRLEEELNQTKLLLEGKNAQYNSLLAEKDELKKQLQAIKESPKFTLFTPIEELRMKYSKQIDEWKQLIYATKIKLETLKELEEIKEQQ